MLFVENNNNKLVSCAGSICFISSSKDVMVIMIKCKMHEYDEVHGAYIVQDLLENTSPASALVLIGQLHEVKVGCIWAESVCQNSVIGKCAHFHIHILLHLPSLLLFF